ncbi:MAG TPA: hypothetical protein VJQ54_07180 [Candidatus Sulfotelmatobacter sp.]|nr:hypothetical protein [Candidatus Sulfotelmatobacter sp.]
MSRLPTNRLATTLRRLGTRFKAAGRHERLRVYLASDALAVCLIHGRFRPRVVETAVIDSRASARNAQQDIADALTGLTSWMEMREFDGTVEWIVGFDHVRYLMLPWDERLSSISFCHTLASALFSQQFHGEDSASSSGKLCFAPRSYGYPRLAALIPHDIVRTLDSFSWRQRRRTTRITPALGVVWDQFFNRFRKGAGTLALVEGQRLLRVAYEQGNIVGLLVRPYSEACDESAFSGASYTFPPHGLDAIEHEELLVAGLTPDDDRRVAYALCGVLQCRG